MAEAIVFPGFPQLPGFPTLPALPDPSQAVTQAINAVNGVVTGFFTTLQTIGNTAISGITNAVNQLKPPVFTAGTTGTQAGQDAGIVPFQIPTPQQLQNMIFSGIEI